MPNPKAIAETVDGHAGFVVCERIRSATGIVDAYPIGFPLGGESGGLTGHQQLGCKSLQYKTDP